MIDPKHKLLSYRVICSPCETLAAPGAVLSFEQAAQLLEENAQNLFELTFHAKAFVTWEGLALEVVRSDL